MEPKINEIGVNAKRKAIDDHRFFSFNIYSMKSALFINKALLWVASNCRKKHDIYYDYSAHRYKTRTDYWNTSNLIGGGFLMKISPTVMKDLRGEIGIKTGREVGTYLIKTAGSTSSVAAYINDKVANLLKTFWTDNAKYQKVSPEKYSTVVQEDGTNPHSDIVGTINYNEYRVLYELLKGRDQTKIKATYGESAFDAMVGTPIENQMVIDAIEILENEVKAAHAEWMDEDEKLTSKCNAELNVINLKYKKLKDEAIQIRDTKVNELNKQIAEMKKQIPTASI